MPFVAVALMTVCGLAVGSVLTMTVERVPAGEPVLTRRPRCVRCRSAIRPRHLVPVVSWLLLRGRCADCRQGIGYRYPLTEIAAGCLFGVATVVAHRHRMLGVLPAWLYLSAIGLALALIDLRVHRLPNRIVLPSYPILAALLALASLLTGDWWALGRAGLAAPALGAFYALLAVIRPAGMGWGDVKLAGLLGAALGFVGWSALLIGAAAAFVLGAVTAIVLVAARRATGSTALPFGPFMMLGTAMGIAAGIGEIGPLGLATL